MKVLRKIIKIDEEKCDGCGLCVPSCAEGAIEIIDGKAKVVSDKFCDGLGACLGKCPNDALAIIEREAEEFKEEAFLNHISEKEKKQDKEEERLACGCPSSTIQSFMPDKNLAKTSGLSGEVKSTATSALSHWPIQIRLVPAHAGFLKNADLLVIADCVAVAFPALHQDLLKGKVLLMGCPKFDETDEHIKKFAEIFKVAGIKSITVAVMEVPCCSGLPLILKKAMQISGEKIPLEEIVISVRGKIISSSSS